MEKVIVNHSIMGFNRVNIECLPKTKDCVVVVVIDEEDYNLESYYNSVLDAIKRESRVILITKEGGNEIVGKALGCLMALYKCYDIYKVGSLGIVDYGYIDRLLNRKPTYDEIQSFIDPEITSYAEMSTIAIGIDSLVRDGNIEGLKTFLSQHLPSISSFVNTIDYMRKVVETSNGNELVKSLEDLKKSLEDREKKYDEIRKMYEKDKIKFDEVNKELELQSIQLKTALSKAEDLQSMASTGNPIIKSYSEINTSLIKCKAKIVLYFKEVTAVPYINSLVVNLMESIKLRKLRVKLVVYDVKSNMNAIYKPLNIVSSTEYMSKRNMLVGTSEKFVVVEPNQIIIDDILKYSANPYDVVIVYDRMKQLNDIVVGNNVTKFFVINSSKDFMEMQSALKIVDKSFIITNSASKIGKEVLDIPNIPDYKGLTETAKLSRYNKLMTSISGKPLIRTITEKARIESIINR